MFLKPKLVSFIHKFLRLKKSFFRKFNFPFSLFIN